MLKNLIVTIVNNWNEDKVCDKTIIGIIGTLASMIIFIAAAIGTKFIDANYDIMMYIAMGAMMTFILIGIKGTQFDEMKERLYEEKEYLMKGRHFKEEG